MKVVLKEIRCDDDRTTSDLAQDEVVEHRVELDVDGRGRTFVVFLRANVLPHLDASVVYGDALLEELLRFEPGALNSLYAAVGRRRRGLVVDLPLLLVDATDANVGEQRA